MKQKEPAADSATTPDKDFSPNYCAADAPLARLLVLDGGEVEYGRPRRARAQGEEGDPAGLVH